MKLPKILSSALGLAVLVVAPVSGIASSEEASQPAAGESPVDEIHRAMAELPDLAGHWKGEGWMRRGPGEPDRFLSEEIVQTKLDGQILVVEGIHRDRENSDEIVFHAFAVLSWDPEADTYRFQSHTASHGGGDFEGYVEDGAFVWVRELAEGRIRYVIRIHDDRWTEIGEFSADGESWSQFFEMGLDRVGEP